MQAFRQQLGFVIRTHREAAGLSQEALAEKTGLHRTYISLIERGKNNATLWALKLIADALDVTLTALVRELERSVSEPA